MSRSNWKIQYQHNSLHTLLNKAFINQFRKTSVKLWDRSSIISQEMLNINFEVYNGQKFLPVLVTQEMVGHKIGEFAFTRKRCVHKKKVKKK